MSLRVTILVLLASILIAQSPSRTTTVGRWKMISDITGKETSIVTISEENGKLVGRFDKLLNQNPSKPAWNPGQTDISRISA